jgi:hypothetical protein
MMIEMGDGKPEFGAKHRRGHLGDQLLHRVGVAAEAGGKIAPKATFMAGPVRKLMRQRCAIMVEVPKGRGLPAL